MSRALEIPENTASVRIGKTATLVYLFVLSLTILLIDIILFSWFDSCCDYFMIYLYMLIVIAVF